MTIAAGFCVRDGILLCADTQYTGGMKIYHPKIFDLVLRGKGACSVHFVLTGHEAYGKMAIQDCQEAITEIPSGKRNYKTIKTAMRAAVKPIHDKYVKPDDELTYFSLVTALWLKADNRLRLLQTQTDEVYEVFASDGYTCLGSGSYLGKYLLRHWYRPSMETSHAVVMAVNALAAVKSFDEYCGGYSDLRLIRPDGGSHVALTGFDLSRSEGYATECARLAGHFMFNISNPLIEDRTFQQNCRQLTLAAADMRQRMKAGDSPWAQVLKALELPPMR